MQNVTEFNQDYAIETIITAKLIKLGMSRYLFPTAAANTQRKSKKLGYIAQKFHIQKTKNTYDDLRALTTPDHVNDIQFFLNGSRNVS